MKLCKDCKHCSGREYNCHKQRISQCSGELGTHFCYEERNSAAPEACGPEARFYESKVDLKWEYTLAGRAYPECWQLTNDHNFPVLARIFVFSDIAIAVRRDGSEGDRIMKGGFVPITPPWETCIDMLKQRVETAVRNGTWEKKK